MIRYLLTDKRLTKRGEQVTIENDTHHPVMIVRNPRGILHSARLDELSEVEPEIEIVEKEIIYDLFNQG